MKISFIDNPFHNSPILTQPVSQDIFESNEFEYFDKDGFDLNKFEVLLYQYNNVHVQDLLNRNANHYVWVDEFKHDKLIIDHSLLMCRYSYGGELIDQIKHYTKQDPRLTKLCQLKHKWGIDINIECIMSDQNIMEVFNHESDYHSYDEYLENKNRIEEFVIRTDFEDAAIKLSKSKSEWEHLCGDDQTDFKARYFGFDRAYTTQKVI